MVKNTYGMGRRSTVRCARCGDENRRPRMGPGETLVMLSCLRCGADIWVRPDIRARWRREGTGQ